MIRLRYSGRITKSPLVLREICLPHEDIRKPAPQRIPRRQSRLCANRSTRRATEVLDRSHPRSIGSDLDCDICPIALVSSAIPSYYCMQHVLPSMASLHPVTARQPTTSPRKSIGGAQSNSPLACATHPALTFLETSTIGLVSKANTMVWPFRTRKFQRIHKVNVQAPQPSPGRYGVAIAMMVKNEAPYISDWLTFHSLAGIGEVILYDNGSTDGTALIAQSFSGMATTVIPWHLDVTAPKSSLPFGCQALAYCHAICTFGQRYRWMAFIDADEYLVPRTSNTIPEALEEVTEYCSVSLPWAMFGHSGNIDMPEQAAPFAYTKRARTSDSEILNFKCIVDPCTVTQVHVHRFLTNRMGNKTSNMLGRTVSYKKRKQDKFVTNEILQLNHYYLKSSEETEEKIRRPAASGADPIRREAKIRRKAAIIESDTVDDTAALEFLARHQIYSSQELRRRFED